MANGINIDTAGLGNLISGIGTAAQGIRAAITGKSVIDPAAEAALEEKLAEIESQAMNAQAAINQAEAASPKLFISGARPAILWIGAIVILYSYVISPVLITIGISNSPKIELGDLWPVITGILGLGTMRTYEKVTGVQGNH